MDPELGPSSDDNIGKSRENNHHDDNNNERYRGLYLDLARPWLCLFILVSCLGLFLPPPSQHHPRNNEGHVDAWSAPPHPQRVPKQQQPQRVLLSTDTQHGNYAPATEEEAAQPHATRIVSRTDSSSKHQRHKQEAVYEPRHKPLLPLDSSDYWGLLAAMLGLLIAAGGGIGGGGILVPIFCLVMGFSPKHAVPLSNVTVLGGSIANVILNATKRHPLADRPLVDWDLILAMEPLTIAGALIGAILNKILDEMLLTLMLVTLLSFTAYTTLRKATSMYRAESAAIRRATGKLPEGTQPCEQTRLYQNQDDDDEGESLEKLLAKDGSPQEPQSDDQADSTSAEQEQHEDNAASRELEQILREERTTPKQNVRVLVLMFVVVLVINILKGGGAFSSPVGIECGSASFWMADFAMLVWILVTAVQCRSLLIQRHERKERCGYRYLKDDIKWDNRATILYPSLCCFSGFFAGMFGIGGGIVKGPLMLAMGVHPAVSSATAACMILFTSFTATTSFVVFGLLQFDYGVLFVVLGFIATYIGQVVMSYLMKKSNRNSYIAFSIGGVVLLSAVLMTMQSLLSLLAGERRRAGGICGREG